MPKPRRFLLTAVSGYAVVIALLAGGVIIAVRQIDSVATGAIGEIRAEERKITLAERLRWNGELVVSAGRGYLVSGDGDFLDALREAESGFFATIEVLRREPLSPGGVSSLHEIERMATAYVGAQARLLGERQSAELGRVADRFETELRPRRRELAAALEHFVASRQQRITDVYRQAGRERAELGYWTWGLLGILFLTAVGIAWYFARLLIRSYRRERDALTAAHEAVIARDDIMGLAAHDLRNPLGAITMKASLLAETTDSERTRQQAQSIEKVALRMANLITAMLDVATIEAGRFSVAPSRLCVRDLVDEASDIATDVCKASGVQVRQRVSEPDLAIRGDRDRLLQVFANLLGNAAKFTPAGGVVTISAAPSSREVLFAVSDTGSGIAPEHLPHIFDRFWKHEAGGRRGTGLGLFIARGIVDAHGGRMWAESRPGRGTTFHFAVPIADPIAPATVARSPSPILDHGLTREARKS